MATCGPSSSASDPSSPPAHSKMPRPQALCSLQNGVSPPWPARPGADPSAGSLFPPKHPSLQPPVPPATQSLFPLLSTPHPSLPRRGRRSPWPRRPADGTLPTRPTLRSVCLQVRPPHWTLNFPKVGAGSLSDLCSSRRHRPTVSPLQT